MLSRDLNPLDRSMDRLLAAMGLLEDAAPMFACASSVPRLECCWPFRLWSQAACRR